MKSNSGSNDDNESKRQAAAARFDNRIADPQPKTSVDPQGPGSAVTRRTLPFATPSNQASSKPAAVVTDHDTNVGQSRPSSEAPSSHVTARSSPVGLQKSPGSQQSFKSSLRRNGGSYRNGGTQALMELEDRISFKTGIALDDDPKADGKKEDLADSAMPEQAMPRASSSNNNAGSFTAENASKKDTHGAMAKLIGVPPEALAKAAAEKKEAGGAYSSHDGTDPEDPAGKLAVAIAITEEEDDDIIPSAIEYDPDAKPPLIRNRRFRLYSLVACMLMVVVVGAVAGLMAHQKKEQDEPQSIATESPGLETSETGAPTRVGANGIIEQLELIVGSEVLMDPSSPYSRAKDWIIFEDPLQLVALDSNLVQRYVLAVVYFKLHEEGDWVSCNAPSEEEPDDFCLYQKLVNIFPFEYRSIPWYRWLSGNHECNWAGLECDEFEQLRGIELVGQEITGTLPIDFIYFPYLQELSMSWNKLHGTIPSEYGEMRQLLNFELHYNELTGSLPSGWSRFMTMQLFNVAANMLSGSIPEEFFAISSLKGLFLYENMLTGTFPSELSQLSLLSKCRTTEGFTLEHEPLAPLQSSHLILPLLIHSQAIFACIAIFLPELCLLKLVFFRHVNCGSIAFQSMGLFLPKLEI